MAYQIIWTAEADNDFHSIIHYLKKHWSDYSAEKFAVRIMKKLERIAAMPYTPKFTSQPNIQIIKLDKKNVLFFTIENNYMVLLSIYAYKKDITQSKYY
ncbi:type II toxin-antitoxin system RelE/ParE family toxin [Ferruginibacter sp. SUN106]|uniref:type II toxin-antitoxin system RelE/ParE family toxin n=1 Tax=Ferruginibacter sp. SUN106 TaxID=2978348 RepID=UPI003D35D51C